MDRDTLRTKLQDSLRDVVDDDSVVISDDTKADDVVNWDSTNHIRLIVAVEHDLHIRFEPEEMVAPDTVGELLDLIQRKLAAG